MNKTEWETRDESAREIEIMGCGQPWCEDCDSEMCAAYRIANWLREQNCKITGHTRGLTKTNQITGRERCRYCRCEIYVSQNSGAG